MIKAVLYDLDGTLLDTKPYIVASYRHVCEQFGLEVITEEKINSLGGASLHDTYYHYHPDYDTEALSRAHLEFQKASQHLIRPFDDTLKTLEAVNGLKLKNGIVTARHANARTLLEVANISHFFSTVVTCDDIEKSKPDPEGISLALKNLGLQPREVVFVGDMRADIDMGKNANVLTIGVACGFSNFEQMASFQPDHVVPSLGDVLKIVEALT